MTEMKLVYIASPYADDIEHNIKMTIEYCRYAAGYGVIPLAPHLLLPRFLSEENPDERERGIKMGLRFLALCSELCIFGDRISEGMHREIIEAKRLDIPMKYIGELEMMGVEGVKQYGVWAKRSAVSVCGAAEAWLKSDGKPLTFGCYEEAAAKAESLMKNNRTTNVSYYPMEMQQKPEEASTSGMIIKL